MAENMQNLPLADIVLLYKDENKKILSSTIHIYIILHFF